MTPTKNIAKKPKPPKGWFMSGGNPGLYEASIDTSPHSGTKCAYLRNTAKVKSASVWATLMQQMGPGRFLNSRVRMSFWIRTADVGGYVQPWMRVDGQEADKLLAFDNMCRRFIMGTTDWTQHHIVLDVPGESTNIAFGVILGGKGNVWLDDVSFEIVSRDVAVTDCPCSQGNFSTKEPTNLDFEQGEEEEVCS